MTEYERRKYYPTTAKLLKAMGYDPANGDVHRQFMDKHKQEMDRKPSFKKHKTGPKPKIKK